MGAVEVEELPAMATTVVLSTFLDVSIPTLARWRSRGEGPKWVRVGEHAVRYPRESVRAWIQENEGRAATDVA